MKGTIFRKLQAVVLSAGLVVLLAGIGGCNSEMMKDIESRIDSLVNNSVAPIKVQVREIQGTLVELKTADSQLDGYIKTLQTTAANLQSALDATDVALAQAKSDLKTEISNEKAAVLAELTSARTAIEGQISQINAAVETLQPKDTALEHRIDTLSAYVNTLNQETKDWASATFSTLEQYNKTAGDVATIKTTITSLNTSLAELETRLNAKIGTDIATAVNSLEGELATKVSEITAAYTGAISTAKTEISAAYTQAIKDAISASEASMKGWVNEQLTGYYTIVQTEAQLSALNTTLTSQLNAQKTYFDELIAAKESDLNGKITASAAVIDSLNTVSAQSTQAIADNAAAIAELIQGLQDAKTELTSAYTTAIATAISTSEGKLEGEIATQIAAVNTSIDTKIAAVNTEIKNLKTRVFSLETAVSTINARLTDIEGRLAELEKIISGIQSVVVVPDYSDGSVRMTDAETNVLRFEVRPLEAAQKVVELGKDAFSLNYVETITKATPLPQIPISSVAFDGQFVLVTADGTLLSDEVKSGQKSASARLLISDGKVTRSSEFFNFTYVVSPKEDAFFGDGQGTVEKPYLIATLHDLDTLAYLVRQGEASFASAVYKQVADIPGAAMQECIGSYASNKPFKGSYDGNGFRIESLSFSETPEAGAGLFGYTDGASLSRVAVNHCTFAGEGQSRGALVGICLNTSLTQCAVGGTVSLGTASCSGGMVGTVLAHSMLYACQVEAVVASLGGTVGGMVGKLDESSTMNACVVNGRVSALSSCGGVVGYVSDGSVMRSVFNGDVVGTDDTGGIVGLMNKGSLVSCTVSGSVRGEASVGGILGRGSVPSAENLLIDQCSNSAHLTAQYNLGGILGYVTNMGVRALVSNCSNRDNTLHAFSSGTNRFVRVGGIVGGTDAASSGPVDVLNSCAYHLSFILDDPGNDNGHICGIAGIVGSLFCEGSISACWSDLLVSDVTAVASPYYKGAIVGYKKASALLTGDNFYDNACTWGAFYDTNPCVGLSTASLTDGALLARLNFVSASLEGARKWVSTSGGQPVPEGEPAGGGAKPIRIMAIGNSFSQDAVEQYLSELLMEAGYDPIVANCYIGGCTLQRHWENESSTDNAKRNSNSYRKLVRGAKTTTENVSIEYILRDEPWDYVIFQQGNGLYGIVDSHYPYLDNFLTYIAGILPAGYRTGYQMNWAFPANCTDTARFGHYNNDQMTMYVACRDAAFTLQDRSHLDVIIPTGTAIQNGRTSSLGDTFNRDWGHLDYNHGRYTASCTWFETLTGINVTTLTYAPSSLTPAVAAICRQAAHNAVQTPKQITSF